MFESVKPKESSAKTDRISLFKDRRVLTILFIAGVIGIGLIMLSEILPKQQKEKPAALSDQFDANSYIADLELRLTDVIATIDGVGRLKIMVTLESTTEKVYAVEQRTAKDKAEDHSAESTIRTQQRDTDDKKIVVIQGENGKNEPIIETTLQPTVKGVVVVCEGGDNEDIRQRVTDVLTTVLGISSQRVCVTKIGYTTEKD